MMRNAARLVPKRAPLLSMEKEDGLAASVVPAHHDACRPPVC